MACEFCGKPIEPGELCRCVRHKGRRSASAGDHVIYHRRRDKAEQELCNLALERYERTGEMPTEAQWSETLNKRAGGICGPKGKK